MRLAGGIIAEVFGVPIGSRVYQKVRYIPRMAIQREITVKLPNSPGALSRVSQLLGGERINMLAMSIDPSGHLRMVVDNPLHAANTLREQHYGVEERDVLYTMMPNEPGSLSRALRLLGDAGVNVEYAYASGIDRVPMVGVVIAVADAQKASYIAGM
jgi:hypothetical protein